MAVETAIDQQAFTNPDEFGVVAVWNGNTINGIPERYHFKDRPGANSRSSISPFIAAAADISTETIQFLTWWSGVSGMAMEEALSILEGEHAGDYRVRDIQRDGELCRLMLNAL